MHAVSLGHVDGPSFWLGLEPGRKLALPLGLLLWYHGLWQRQVWYQRKGAALPRQAKGFKSASGGTRSELAAIDAWIAASSDKTLNRAHAIRRLVELGLKVKK